jgi:hypothetical protein
MLLTAQVAQASTTPTTASVEAPAPTVVQEISINTKNPQLVEAKVVKTPDFDTEVLSPLRAAQEQKAKEEAKKAEAARLAALAAAAAKAQTLKPVSFTASGPLSQEQITYLGNCESGMTATRNSGNGFYGAFQFTIGTWNAMGTGYARADMAPLDVQISAVQKLLSRSSIYSQFPGCARKMASIGLI